MTPSEARAALFAAEDAYLEANGWKRTTRDSDWWDQPPSRMSQPVLHRNHAVNRQKWLDRQAELRAAIEADL